MLLAADIGNTNIGLGVFEDDQLVEVYFERESTVGLAGGMGGFLLPIMFGALLDLTGVNSTIFMLMWGVTTVSLTWMYWTEVRPLDRARHKKPQALDTLE